MLVKSTTVEKMKRPVEKKAVRGRSQFPLNTHVRNVKLDSGKPFNAT